jgi:hypothetical protein
MIRNLILLLDLILLLAVGLLAARWLLRPASGPPSRQQVASYGSLGKYGCTSLDRIKEFNSEVCSWLIQRGFRAETNTTFADVAGGRERNEPGSLLCRRYDTTNRVFVFIPDQGHRIDPSNKVQIILFKVEFAGECDDVRKRNSEIELTSKEFLKRFPSTWEYKPRDAEPDAAPNER